MRPRFLLDENLNARVVVGFKRLYQSSDITIIGSEHALPKSTPDPDILEWIEQTGYILVTNNRKSMPVHIAAHFAQGRHFPGIIIITKKMSIGRLIADLAIIWGASDAAEYVDKIEYIPL